MRGKYTLLWVTVLLGGVRDRRVPVDARPRRRASSTSTTRRAPLFLAAIGFLLLVCIYFSYELSRLEERTRILAEELAIVRGERETRPRKLIQAWRYPSPSVCAQAPSDRISQTPRASDLDGRGEPVSIRLGTRRCLSRSRLWKQLRPDFNDAVQFPDIEHILGAEPDLDVAHAGRAKPTVLRGSRPASETMAGRTSPSLRSESAGHRTVVGHVDQGQESRPPSSRDGPALAPHER